MNTPEIKTFRRLTELGRIVQEVDRASDLESPEIQVTVVGLIHDGHWAPGAVRNAIEAFARQFDAADDPYLRQRETDVRALGTRMISHLFSEGHHTAPGTVATILIGRQLSATDIGAARPSDMPMPFAPPASGVG